MIYVITGSQTGKVKRLKNNVKVKFATSVVNNPTVTRGSSTINYTYFTFIRLGDT